MFGDLMGQMQEQQEKLKQQIALIKLTEKSADGLVEITMNGVYQIVQMDIHSGQDVDPEMIADLTMITINRLSDRITTEVERITQESVSSMLPGGLGGLGNLLG